MLARTYKQNGEEVLFDITISDIKEVCDSSKIKSYLYFEKPYKNGLMASEYLYGLFSIYDEYVDLLDDETKMILDFMKEDNYDKYSFIESRSVVLSDELVNEVYNNLNPNYNDLQKVIYIYLKLCLILESDDDYLKSIFVNCADKYSRTRKRLKSVNLENNKVVCYEFAEIFNYFLKNIKCLVQNIYSYGGCNHIESSIFIDEFELSFDPLNCFMDLVNFKFNDGVNGISVLDGDYKKFKEEVRKVSDDINNEKNKYYRFNNLFKNELFDSIYKLNIDEDLKVNLTQKLKSINRLPIKDGDLCNHIINTIANEFLEDFGTKISLTVILTNYDELNICYAISLMDNNNQKVFILINQDGSFNILNEYQLSNLVKLGKVFWTEASCGLYYIPTIDEKIPNNTGELNIARKRLIEKVKNSNEQEKERVKII